MSDLLVLLGARNQYCGANNAWGVLPTALPVKRRDLMSAKMSII